MPSNSLSIDQVLTWLSASPPRLTEMTSGFAAATLQTRPTADDWSANEVLAHVRACADVWGGCIFAMLAEEHPTLRAINPLTWIKQTDYRDLDFHSSLSEFVAQRDELMAILGSLAPDGWSRAATVTGAGKVLERTVLSYGQWLAGHERPHVKQIDRIVASQRSPAK